MAYAYAHTGCDATFAPQPSTAHAHRVLAIDDVCFAPDHVGAMPDMPNASGMSARANLGQLLAKLPHRKWLVIPTGNAASAHAPAGLGFDNVVTEEELHRHATTPGAPAVLRVQSGDISASFTVDLAVLAAVRVIQRESVWAFDAVKYLNAKARQNPAAAPCAPYYPFPRVKNPY